MTAGGMACHTYNQVFALSGPPVIANLNISRNSQQVESVEHEWRLFKYYVMNDPGGGFDGCSVSDHVYDLLGWLLLSPLPEIQVPGPVRARQDSPYCICIIQFYDSMVHWWNKFVDQYLWKYFILLKESEEINVIDTWYLLPSSKCTFTKDIVCRNPSL